MTDLQDWLAWLRTFGRPITAHDAADLDEIDAHLTNLEEEQREMARRLQLLERRASPRGIRRRDD